MLDREHADYAARGDDREQGVSARQAAEALFKAKPQAPKQPEVRYDPSENPQPRQPRVLGISAPGRSRQEDAEPKRPATAPATLQKRIADAEAARVRIWVKYGMTVAQVAKVYGVTLIEVQRVLHDH